MLDAKSEASIDDLGTGLGIEEETGCCKAGKSESLSATSSVPCL